MSINPNFDGAAAYNVARAISQRWSAVWRPAQPLYAMIKGKKNNFNNALKDATGLKMILPVMVQGPSTSARAATTSNQFTAITPYARRGFSQAEYYYATYENALFLNIQDLNQLVAGSTSLIPVIPGAIEQLLQDFVQKINADMVGTQNGTGRDGTGQLTGEQYILSASNSPGNISQTTYPVWAAGLTAANCPFATSLISNEFDRIHDLGRGDADFIQCSYTSTNNVFGKLRDQIGSAQVVMTQESETNFGFKSFEYMGMMAFQDGRLGDVTAGSMVIGKSDTWWLNQESDDPILANVGGESGVKRLQGTTSVERMYMHTMAIGNNDPAANSFVTSIQ